MTIPGLNILIFNYKLHEQHLQMLAEAAKGASITLCDKDNIAEYINDCDILAYFSLEPINALIANAPRLKWIHSIGAGVESIDFDKLRDTDVIVTNSKGVGGIPISEHLLSMMLAFTRGLNIYLRQQQERFWKARPADEIYEKTLGIIGLGSIGRTIAKKAKALGMHVLAVNQRQSTELFVDKMYAANPESVLEVFAKSDFVVICLPLTEQTKNSIGLAQFKAMKRSAYFFNIARGSIVNQADLITALQEHLIRGAGLDVFAEEPLPADNPLWEMPNVIITPHMGAVSTSYTDRAAKLFADNLTRYLEGTQMVNLIDKNKGY